MTRDSGSRPEGRDVKQARGEARQSGAESASPNTFVSSPSMTIKEMKLRECPFCGKPPLIVCPDNSYGAAMITCGDANECEVEPTAWADLPSETIEDAKRRWNTRSSPEAVTVMREALTSVQQRLVNAAEHQCTKRGDYLYKGHPDEWIAVSINEIDAALLKVALPL
jgi:ssDNA-binding Zn-finger/Zn-ribbon topoisomerase 1